MTSAPPHRARAALSRRAAIGWLAGGAASMAWPIRGAPSAASTKGASLAADAADELAAAARELLPEPGDTAAFAALGDGALWLEHDPLRLRQRALLPGSLVKLFTADALLRTGFEDRTYHCRGAHRDARGRERRCWLAAGHGPMRLRTAIAQSCNAWFYERAQDLPAEALLAAFDRFGLGAPWSAEAGAVGPDRCPSFIAEEDLPDVAVGDHESLRVTPLSLLRAVSRLTLAAMPLGAPPRAPPPSRRLPLGAGGRPAPLTALRDTARAIYEGMGEAARTGTLRDPFRGLSVAGKTGTARRPARGGFRGLVAGAYPFEAPVFSFVVVKERGRGATDAAPVAARLLRVLERALVAREAHP